MVPALLSRVVEKKGSRILFQEIYDLIQHWAYMHFIDDNRAWWEVGKSLPQSSSFASLGVHIL